MKFAIAAVFCLGFALSARAANQLDILTELDKAPSPLVTYPNLTPSTCAAQYSDANAVVSEFMKLDISLRTAANLKKMLEFQMNYSGFIAKQDPKNNTGCPSN